MALKARQRALNAKQRALLKAYSITGNMVKAAEAVQIDRGMHYRWLKLEDGAYAEAYEAARVEFADILEAACMARANEGVLEPVFYKGKVVGAIRRYSDGVAQFLLRGLRPEIYRERVDAVKDGPAPPPLVINTYPDPDDNQPDASAKPGVPEPGSLPGTGSG